MRIRIRRPRLTYSNVMVTGLMFIVLGGGAYATHTHRMGTQDLRNGAVTTPKIAGGAVTQGKLRGNMRPRWAVVNAGGQLARGRLAASAGRTDTGEYSVMFRSNVRGCSFVATPEGMAGAGEEPATTSVRTLAGERRGVRVRVFSATGQTGQQRQLINRAFHLQVSC